ncbi:MAG: TPM domain-containing protein [Lachnospiraceae bacterium]|uniref:TPM domain-containing protein n=1 Tax=uncultured Acetatifactor sp. TaxID=1671927 RepID=UPI002636A8AE|nr:TPM domain-containing protein [uncultured Acetatifactor sp.]MCI8787514.1 TPM domain-containing protein [Lachnospiraceae bacterium]
MEDDFKKEARKQYLHYFRFWFLGIAVLAAACIVMIFVQRARNNAPRANTDAPVERVYDYADVLTDQEEENLREYIDRAEKKLHIDIVLVTFSKSVEGEEALEQGLDSRDWERNMQTIADNFWDQNRFGYNKGFEGDGVLLLHNWYQGQNGEHLSTSGSVEARFSVSDIDQVLYAVDDYYASDPYRAYMAYVKEVERLMGHSLSLPFSWGLVIVLPILVAVFYAVNGASQKKARNTVAVNAYVTGGKPELNGQEDVLIRKNVTSRRIETQTAKGGSGGGSSGGGGHHRSSSGASHGGGSHRH